MQATKTTSRSLPPAPVRRPLPWRTLLGAATILIASLIVYLPAIRGGFIWDDPDYVVKNQTLRTLSGLAEMWTAPHSLPQWYPMVHTTFWIEYHLFGLDPLPYHLDNVLLHVAAALLLWRLLWRLQVPGAWLAAAVFALHPVQVESVAWITERKNVLSAVFYFSSALAALRFLRSEGLKADARRRWYLAALALFLGALLSKTVTATLPAALLVVLWWKWGAIRRRDLLALLPFFLIGIALGLLTAWLETHYVGATGEHIAELNLSPADRILIAGRAVCFYARQLIWPHPLVFIYPRWDIDPHLWWQWLFPAGVAAVVVALFLLRHRLGRGPLAAVLIFIGTLFPALGFVNVYPMRFSFVADHFQYHASAALIALIAAVLWRVGQVYASVVLVPLAVLTRLQTPIYTSAETLWTDTLARNPGSWMVHTNLAHALRERGEKTGDPAAFDAAEYHYRRALELAPQLHDTHADMGIMYGFRGRYEDALRELNEALRINPRFPAALYSIGQVYALEGKSDLAIEYFRRTLQIAPTHPKANYRLGIVLLKQGDPASAVEYLRRAVAGMPEDADARAELGSALIPLRQYDEAIYNLSDAVRIRPEDAQAWTNLGAAQLLSGRRREAAESFRRALEIDPRLAPAQRGLQRSLSS